MEDKIIKCKYCGKPVPQLKRDTFGRINPKVKHFCDQKCYQKWFAKENPDYWREYSRKHPEKYNKRKA